MCYVETNSHTPLWGSQGRTDGGTMRPPPIHYTFKSGSLLFIDSNLIIVLEF